MACNDPVITCKYMPQRTSESCNHEGSSNKILLAVKQTGRVTIIHFYDQLNRQCHWLATSYLH